MKRFLVLISSIVGCIVADANTARDYYNSFDDRVGLYLFSLRSDMQPKNGCVYNHGMTGILKVRQTVDGYCIVSGDKLEANPIAVKALSAYADGTFLGKGYYEYVGLTAFTGANGSPRQLYTFREIEKSICDEIAHIAVAKRQLQEAINRSVKLSGEVQAEKKKLAEEVEAEKVRAKNERLKLENEREISRLRVEQKKKLDELAAQKREEQRELKPKLQSERKAYAESLLKGIDFNVKHHYVVQRSIRKMFRKDIEIDPVIVKLASLQDRQDWLGMLSLMDDEEYDEYPKESIIDSTVQNMCQREYAVIFEIEKVPYGMNPVRFIHKKSVKVAGGEDERWEYDATRSPKTIDNREYGQSIANGTYKFVARWRVLRDCAYFCRDDHGESSLARYANNVLKKHGSQELTESDVESYGEWLREN